MEVENAHVEIKLCKKLIKVDDDADHSELVGKNRIVDYLDSFNFRSHVIIIFEVLHFSLYKY